MAPENNEKKLHGRDVTNVCRRNPCAILYRRYPVGAGDEGAHRSVGWAPFPQLCMRTQGGICLRQNEQKHYELRCWRGHTL